MRINHSRWISQVFFATGATLTLVSWTRRFFFSREQMCNVSKCHLRDVTFAVINLCHGSDTCLNVANNFGASVVIYFLPLSCQNTRVLSHAMYRYATPCVHKARPSRLSNYRSKSIERYRRKRRAKYRLKLFIYRGMNPSNTHVRKYSEPPTLRYIPLVLCVSLNPVRDRKLLSPTRAVFEGQCQRHTVDGESTVDDAWKGTISSVMFRNAFHSTLPLFSFGKRENIGSIVAMLCATCTRLTRHQSHHWRIEGEKRIWQSWETASTKNTTSYAA